jgi:hypothetical protein
MIYQTVGGNKELIAEIERTDGQGGRSGVHFPVLLGRLANGHRHAVFEAVGEFTGQ